MKKIDLVNPWQRDQAARLIRMYRYGGATNPAELAAINAATRAAKECNRYTALALNFIADKLKEAMG